MLDVELLSRHVAAGMGRHVRWLLDNGFKVPPEVVALVDTAALWSSEGLDGSFLTVVAGDRHGDRVGAGPLLLTFQQAADVLGVSLSTIKRLTGAGALPVVRIGGGPRVRRSDLDDYVEGLAPTRNRRRVEEKAS